MNDTLDKSHRGNASQFFVAGELCRRGIVAVVTLGNCPNTDILCSNPQGTHFAHIQVKTFIPGTRTCSVGRKAERDYGKNFFWVLGGIPLSKAAEPFEYYIIPAADVAANVSACFELWALGLGKSGQKRDADTSIRTIYLPPHKNRNGWNIGQYRNNWGAIETCLGMRTMDLSKHVEN